MKRFFYYLMSLLKQFHGWAMTLIFRCVTPSPPKVIATNFLWDDASFSSHYYLSDTIDDGTRGYIVSRLKDSGYRHIFIYFCNEGDYGGKSVSCFEGTVLYSPISEAKLRVWDDRIRDLREDKEMWIVGWLFADNSSNIRKAFHSNRQAVKDFVKVIVDRYEDSITHWVLILEADEIYDDNAVNEIGQYLKSISSKPVGIHQWAGRWNMGYWDWVDFMCVQYGFNTSPSFVADMTRRAKAELGKPVIATEYARSGDTAEARELGKACWDAGADGIGNSIDVGVIPDYD